jgi:hemolysin activation/secretion protein
LTNGRGHGHGLWRGLRVLVGCLLFAAVLHGGEPAKLRAQSVPRESQADREEIRRRQRQERAEQESRLAQPRVSLGETEKAAPAERTTHIPEDPKGVLVERVILDIGERSPPWWLAQIAARYAGKRLGADGIGHAVAALGAACIERGFVTSRVLLPEQDIATTRTLRIVIVPGRVGKVLFSPESTSWGGVWWNAFPTGPGEILNLRDIEQGLEQMKRVPTQDVTMDLKPGANSGESDIVITRQNKLPLRGHLGIDNSGDKNTGQWQASGTVFIDNPFWLNDLFSATLNGAVATSTGQGTSGDNLSYSVPYGRFTFHAALNSYDYHQTVQGYYSPYDSSGKSRSLEGRLQYLLIRNQNSKTSLQTRIALRRNHNYLDGEELDVQRRNTTLLEVALMHQQNFGQILLDFSVAVRRGMHWFDATTDPLPHVTGDPTNFYNALTADASLRAPLALGSLQCNLLTSIRGQATRHAMFASEQFTIGNRYTVRGFDGVRTLAGEQGITWRNEFGVALGQTGQSLYIALDYGHVWAWKNTYLPGNDLLGTAIGIRGGWKCFYYDATIGCPLYKPTGFHTANTTFTIQAGMQF